MKKIKVSILRKIKSKSGMTLFEMLVAMAIMAIAFTTTIGAIAMSQKTYKGIAAKIDACSFLTENVNSVRKVIRSADANYKVEITGALLTSEEEAEGVYEIENQKVTLTSSASGYRGHFENDEGVIKFMCDADALYSGVERGTIMAINSNQNAPLTAKIVFTDETDPDEMYFTYIVSIYDGEECVAYAKANAIPLERENMNY